MVKEGEILSPDSKSSQQFVHGIKVLMARNYSLNLGEETIKGMTEEARAGIYPSYAPVGYRNVDGTNGKRTIVPDPDTAPTITDIFERFAAGAHSVKSLVPVQPIRLLDKDYPAGGMLSHRQFPLAEFPPGISQPTHIADQQAYYPHVSRLVVPIFSLQDHGHASPSGFPHPRQPQPKTRTLAGNGHDAAATPHRPPSPSLPVTDSAGRKQAAGNGAGDMGWRYTVWSDLRENS
jgi:hypothetical protein